MIKQVILASQSPRRKRLLERINLKFDIVVSSAPEHTRADLDAITFAREMSQRKSREVASRKSNALVIGADTIVAYDNEILGKPVDEKQARQMLLKLSNDSHQVVTGVSLIQSGTRGEIENKLTFHTTTDVFFGSLEEAEIDEYIQTGGPMDKAGSYGIQDDWGALFVEKIIGDYYNVVGFPLHSFYQHLKSFAPNQVPHAI
jgi:septum formation protein